MYAASHNIAGGATFTGESPDEVRAQLVDSLDAIVRSNLAIARFEPLSVAGWTCRDALALRQWARELGPGTTGFFNAPMEGRTEEQYGSPWPSAAIEVIHEVTLLSNNVSHDTLRTAAEFLGVPFDRGAIRPDGTPWWEATGSHPMNTSHACGCAVGEGTSRVELFYDHDMAAVTAPEDHPVWAAISA